MANNQARIGGTSGRERERETGEESEVRGEMPARCGPSQTYEMEDRLKKKPHGRTQINRSRLI